MCIVRDIFRLLEKVFGCCGKQEQEEWERGGQQRYNKKRMPNEGLWSGKRDRGRGKSGARTREWKIESSWRG